MDTRLLRTFATVAKTENLTAAAERLHLVQSTVTAQVQALEKELDLRLFDRLPRGVGLTGAGREVLGQAEAVLESESRLLTVAVSAGGVGGQVTGRVMLSAGGPLGSGGLPGVVAPGGRGRPRVRPPRPARRWCPRGCRESSPRCVAATPRSRLTCARWGPRPPSPRSAAA